MIKIGLCEDNDLYIKQLSSTLRKIEKDNNLEFEINGFNCGEDLVDFCSKHKNYFDILFLDVLMHEMNGIEAAQAIRKMYSSAYMIFVTNSKEYALDSYSVNAYGYILKPFSHRSIESKVLDLVNKIDSSNKNTMYVKNNQDIYSLKLDEVVYFESNLRKITAHLINGEEIKFYNKISNLESEINSNLFVRCHRSFLVNLIYIKNIVTSNLITTTERVLPISKKYLSPTRVTFTYYIKSKLSN
ncbi:MAG: LytR/AlgR family response regulator transcription factor [Romboutsia sp.]|uniref:LytR/AlgR family response regulator transcription factor n=1 Tax=Romboutsia sp. TaxID=1965302 RepID=UPI003F2CE05D